MVRYAGTFGKRKDKKTGKVTHTVSDTVVSGGEQKGDRKESRFSKEKRVKAKDVVEQPDFVAAPKKTESQKMDAIIGSGKLSDTDRNRLVREENEKLKPQDQLPGEKEDTRTGVQKLTDTPLGIGTTIKTVGRGLSKTIDLTTLGAFNAEEEYVKALGDTGVKDILVSAATLTALSVGGFLVKGATTKIMSKVGTRATTGILQGGNINTHGLSKLLGLSPKDSILMKRVISGKGLKTAAKTLKTASPSTVKKILSSGWTKLGVGALSGVLITTGWLASDNILTGSTFTAKLVREGVEEGIISKEEGLGMLEEIRAANAVAEGFVRARDKVDPLTYGILGEPYLVNAERSNRNLDLHEALLKNS